MATAVLATDPTIMLIGPGPAAKKCLKSAGLEKSDIDLWEINEAFASVAMRYMKDLDIDHEITNCQRRCDRHGASAGCNRRDPRQYHARRTRAARSAARHAVALCGRRHGISTIIERV